MSTTYRPIVGPRARRRRRRRRRGRPQFHLLRSIISISYSIVVVGRLRATGRGGLPCCTNAYWNWNADVKLRIGLDVSSSCLAGRRRSQLTGRRKQGIGSMEWNDKVVVVCVHARRQYCDDEITSTTAISGEQKRKKTETIDKKKAGCLSESDVLLYGGFWFRSVRGGFLALSNGTEADLASVPQLRPITDRVCMDSGLCRRRSV